ncbi:S-adenosyl-L-methionine-dependent methyltransferase [Laetiporus sulphureus 93-53]|uniref:S-adenosyl-L-methionine-dependent methyltransferase n=1 Tax=Laetiporus sulphureus 93-53 TaxID=1314785 RepID=A0A165CQP8_9APHY|nr:S-adenosyl-L-methionine-dependent methyltransferase [Laetiporus sulphureus 93-53]KZT03249.1 S-adenosyl-L-methionine-dependent methyltransferase [Laetiporus sulphureus 93-53]
MALMASAPSVQKAKQLRSLVRLLANTAEVVIKEWEIEEQTPPAERSHLPSPTLFEARRTFIGAYGMGIDLVHDPVVRMTEVINSYFNSRALRIAAESRIADVLDGADPEEGISIQDISRQVGIDAQSLGRVLRCLCTIHIFAEVKDNYYVNNAASQRLVRNEPLRCWLLMQCTEVYTASDKLPTVLYGSFDKPSRKSAFQEAYATDKDFWEWLEQMVELPDGAVAPRPEREIWRTGIWEFGAGPVSAPAVCDDFPWKSLGSSVVVDVGAGIGGMSMELAKRYPLLRFIVQDRAMVIQEAAAVWQKELPEALSSGHDWEDDVCVTILSLLRKAMGLHSRILIAGNVMQTTVDSSYLKSAPSPLPANYGYGNSFANMHDLYMFTMVKGGERTVEEFSILAARSGLQMTKVYECRGLSSITEMRRDDYAE